MSSKEAPKSEAQFVSLANKGFYNRVSFHRVTSGIIQSGQPLINKVERQVGQDGTERWLLTTKVPVFDAEGQVTGLVGVSKDISERNGMGFYIFETVSRNQRGDDVCTATWTNIVRGV